MKVGEYAEAERAMQLGASLIPGTEMLDAALLTLQGHSQIYYAGGRSRPTLYEPKPGDFRVYDAAPVPAALVDDDRHDNQLGRMDRVAGKGLVHVSQRPIIPVEECERAIEIAENWGKWTSDRHAHWGEWTSDRDNPALKGDMAVKDVPELLDWFNDKLETIIFPMLASRFPELIPSADAIRAHDAFIVRYDANGHASLATHQDESTFSFTVALNDRSDYEGGGTYFEVPSLSSPLPLFLGACPLSLIRGRGVPRCDCCCATTAYRQR